MRSSTRSVGGRRRVAAALLSIGVLFGAVACSTPAAPGSGGAGAGASGTSGAASGPFSERPSEPFEPSTGSGADTGLPKRVASSMREVSSPGNAGVSAAMRQAAESRGMEYVETVTDGDSAKAVDQLTTLLSRGVGGVFVWDTDPTATGPVEEQLREAGAATFPLSHGPGTTPMVAVQKELGAALAESAVDFVKNDLGGKAQVALLTLDNLPAIQPGFQEIRDQLTAIGPDVEIVSDVIDDPGDPTFAFNTMNSVLQAHPDVNVVIGLDPSAYSAMAALENAGKDPATTFVGGLGGDPRVGELIASGTSLYKASASFNTSLWGYSAGQWGADWIEGKNVPQLAILKPVLLDSKEAIDQFQADVADPAGTYTNKMSTYQELLGTVNYANRTNIWDSTDPSGDAAS